MKLFLMVLIGLTIISQNPVFAETISVRATSLNIGQISLSVAPSCTTSVDSVFSESGATLKVKINGVPLTYGKSDWFPFNSLSFTEDCEESKKAAAGALNDEMKTLTDAQSGDVMNDLGASGPNRRVCYKTVLDVYFDNQTNVISQIVSKHIAARCP